MTAATLLLFAAVVVGLVLADVRWQRRQKLRAVESERLHDAWADPDSTPTSPGVYLPCPECAAVGAYNRHCTECRGFGEVLVPRPLPRLKAAGEVRHG